MLKQLIEDVSQESAREDYIEKLKFLGQTDASISLRKYPIITPEKIISFLEKNGAEILGGEKKYKKVEFNYESRVNPINDGSVGGWFRFLYDYGWGMFGGVERDYHVLCLREVPIERFQRLIPESCVDKAIEAKKSGLFDYFTVAYPEAVKAFPDPVIFGRKRGSDNRFFIAQWDNDVTLDDLL